MYWTNQSTGKQWEELGTLRLNSASCALSLMYSGLLISDIGRKDDISIPQDSWGMRNDT